MRLTVEPQICLKSLCVELVQSLFYLCGIQLILQNGSHSTIVCGSSWIWYGKFSISNCSERMFRLKLIYRDYRLAHRQLCFPQKKHSQVSHDTFGAHQAPSVHGEWLLLLNLPCKHVVSSSRGEKKRVDHFSSNPVMFP